MRAGLTVLMTVLALPLTAAAEGMGFSKEVMLATYYGTSYALTARCLTKQMSNSQIAAMALIYAPPTTEAHVLLWLRGSEHGVPVGVFHVRQGKPTATLVSFEETQHGRLDALARAAAVRCAW